MKIIHSIYLLQQQPKRPSPSKKKPDHLPPAVPPPPSSQADDEGEDEAGEEEDEDEGTRLMERIRANSRCLKAQISAQNRRTVTDTGTAGRRPLLPGRRQEDAKNGKGIIRV